MNTTVLWSVLLGTGIGVGMVAIMYGARRTPPFPKPRLGRWLPETWRGKRLGTALLAGLLSVAVTGWPVAGVLSVVAVLALPDLLAPDRAGAVRQQRMEAIATWAEMLRDTLSVAAGLQQAVLATADVAPLALRTEIETLARRIRAGQPFVAALRRFADDVDDPLADMVVAALTMAAQRQAKHLSSLLGELAETVREQVAMRQRIDAGRASVRTSVRVITAVTVLMAAGLVVLNRPYLEPFDTPVGQVGLAVVGVLFGSGFVWLRSIAVVKDVPRVLGRRRDEETPC
ncbi:type II secretion system F family protein [Streptomyces monticola]|uniref:Type II secretion system F family protein n=1 Tax=Streptomyces monticola TaxID=2666263 RepID=A0ABW2JMH1_9ACTN